MSPNTFYHLLTSEQWGVSPPVKVREYVESRIRELTDDIAKREALLRCVTNIIGHWLDRDLEDLTVVKRRDLDNVIVLCREKVLGR